MHAIESISARTVLNSHAAFTTEWVITLSGGARGRGASPEGETISIFEDTVTREPATVIAQLRDDGLLGRPLRQEELDAYLESRFELFGRRSCYGLSLAFHDAGERAAEAAGAPPARAAKAPRLCLNVLNGGRHAYTNPVLSDFTEYLLAAHDDDLVAVLQRHAAIQAVVREELARRDRVMVDGNPVVRLGTPDNRSCIEFLLGVLERLGLGAELDLMIDASAGDLWTGAAYRLALTDGRERSEDDFVAYWLDLLRQYPLRLLEDPFREQDHRSWAALRAAADGCSLIGDNLYSSDAARVARGAAEGLSDGVIIKPNQAGTVSAVCRTFETARRCGQLVIASHRSISTESTLEARLACRYGADLIKIGPLLTDYSSVLRLNDIIRMTS